MNHVNVEEVEAQPDAVIGKFLVKSFTAIVLFDTGASHSYISRGFVDMYKLPTKVQVNHINMEEVEEQPDAVIGKILIKSFTALVLFGTGASRSYISRGFVDKFK